MRKQMKTATPPQIKTRFEPVTGSATMGIRVPASRIRVRASGGRHKRFDFYAGSDGLEAELRRRADAI